MSKFQAKNSGGRMVCKASNPGFDGRQVFTCAVETEQPSQHYANQASSKPLVEKAASRTSPTINLTSSYPWEYVNDSNRKVWRFILYSKYASSFDPAKLKSTCKIIEDYICEYFFPTYRIKAELTVYQMIDPSYFTNQNIKAQAAQFPNLPNPTEYIPIYLVPEFDGAIGAGFGSSVHGGTNDSVLNAVNPLIYINGNDQSLDFAPLTPGYPWAVIAAGSTASGNGVAAEVASNLSSGLGPTDFWSVFEHTLASNIIEILVNPANLIYILSGDCLGLALAPGQRPRETAYLKSACAPFSLGLDNIVKYKGNHSMPNFAFPCYFHPYADELSKAKTGVPTAVYDVLGNGRAPLTPYKGVQFVMYQEAVDDLFPAPTVSDMLTGNYISSPSDPRNVLFVPGTSIYDYASWGFSFSGGSLSVNAYQGQGREEDVPRIGVSSKHHHERLDKLSEKLKVAAADPSRPKLLARAGLFKSRRLSAAQVEKHAGSRQARAVRSARHLAKSAPPPFDPKKPQVLPFQYVNPEGFLVQRYAVVNYAVAASNIAVPAAQVDDAIKAVLINQRQNQLPHWNILAEIRNISVPNQAAVPIYDGTFIPLIITIPEIYQTDTVAVGFISGGASNLNNVPDNFAGPTTDFYFKDGGGFLKPNLPLGNPYLVLSNLNMHADCILTTNKPGFGPFRAGVASFEPPGFSLPFTAKAVVAAGDDTCCTAPSGTTNGNPIAGNILIFGNDPPCATAGPTRYRNVDNSGCAASISVRRFASSSPGFPSNLGIPYVPNPSQYMVGVNRQTGDLLMAEAAINPNLTITIGLRHFPAPESSNALSEVLCHEVSELNGDANYATYVATGDPPSDNAILFCQLESGDPCESTGQALIDIGNGKYLRVESDPYPAHFIPNLKRSAYDPQGLLTNPLIPFARQQCVGTYKTGPNTSAPIFGPQLVSLESTVYPAEFSITTFSGQNAFNHDNFFPAIPGDPSSLGSEVLNAPDDEISTTPFASIVDNLRHNNNVYTFKYGGLLD